MTLSAFNCFAKRQYGQNTMARSTRTLPAIIASGTRLHITLQAKNIKKKRRNRGFSSLKFFYLQSGTDQSKLTHHQKHITDVNYAVAIHITSAGIGLTQAGAVINGSEGIIVWRCNIGTAMNRNDA